MNRWYLCLPTVSRSFCPVTHVARMNSATQLTHCACSSRWYRGKRECDVLFHKSAFTRGYRARSDGTQRDSAPYMEARINEGSLHDEEIEDDRLRPIFTCRYPALPPEGQVAFTLREICGLTMKRLPGISRHAGRVWPRSSCRSYNHRDIGSRVYYVRVYYKRRCGDKKKELCRT